MESARIDQARGQFAQRLAQARREQKNFRPCLDDPGLRVRLAAAALELELVNELAAQATANVATAASAAAVLALCLDDLLAELARLGPALARTAGITAQDSSAYLGLFETSVPRAARHAAIVAGQAGVALARRAAVPGTTGLPASNVAALTLLDHGDNPPLAGIWRDGLASGARRAAIAALEADAGYDFDAVRSRLQRGAGAAVLVGAKSMVPDGMSADLLLVSVRVMETSTTDGPDDDGRSLYCIEAAREGVQRVGVSAVDGRDYADIRLERVAVREVDRLGPRGDATPLLLRAIDAGCVALCDEALGLLEDLVDGVARATDANDGKGRARLARLLVHLEKARAATRLAQAGLGAADAVARLRAVSLGKHVVGVAARFIGEHAVRGGAPAARAAFARLHAIDLTWGDATHHLERYAGLL